MREETFLAGLGGQGVLLAGQLLARAGMNHGRKVSWYPMYSPEVRGGSTTCTVVFADGRVGSPISGRPSSMLLMDAIAFETFAGRVAVGGLLVLNSSMIEQPVARDDCEVVMVPAGEIAVELGNERTVNMIMIGAYVAKTGILTVEAVAEALREMLPERHHKHMPANIAALERGAEIGSGSKQAGG